MFYAHETNKRGWGTAATPLPRALLHTVIQLSVRPLPPVPLQFGPGAMQQHGFARNLDWAVSSTSADPNPDERDPSVEVVLTESDYTLKMWPHKFKVRFVVSGRPGRL